MCVAIVFEHGMFSCCYNIINIHVCIAFIHSTDCCGHFFVLMVTLCTTVSSYVYIYNRYDALKEIFIWCCAVVYYTSRLFVCLCVQQVEEAKQDLKRKGYKYADEFR